MPEPQKPSAGLADSVKRLAGNVVATVEVRLQLFATELQLEKLRLFESLAWLSLAWMVGVLALVSFGALLLLWVDPHQRLWAAAGLGLFLLAAAALAFAAARSRLRAGEAAFSATLAELRSDLSMLRSDRAEP